MNVTGASILGTLPDSVEHPWEYFAVRGTFLDCRGPLAISKDSVWGLRTTVLTRGHNIQGMPDGVVGASIDRPVIVEGGVWVGSGAVLYNCIIRSGVIVGAGAVVKSCEVGPGVIVDGNPARVVAVRDGNQWRWLTERWRTLDRRAPSACASE